MTRGMCTIHAACAPDCAHRPELHKRSSTPPKPALPVDKVRLHVAMFRMARALEIQLDPAQPDHLLLEQIADAIEPKLARALREGVQCAIDDGGSSGALKNKYDGTHFVITRPVFR